MIQQDKSNFVIRQPRLKLWHMAIIGFSIAAAILLSMNSSSDLFRGVIVIIITLSILALLYLMQSSGADQRSAAEFQALVYSGAMRVNSLLTLILYRDGSIFYLDQRYSTHFTNGSPYHNLDQFLTTMGLESVNKVFVYDAIRDLTKVEFEYVYKEGRKSAPLRIGIYPLERPEGFVVLTVSE